MCDNGDGVGSKKRAVLSKKKNTRRVNWCVLGEEGQSGGEGVKKRRRSEKKRHARPHMHTPRDYCWYSGSTWEKENR